MLAFFSQIIDTIALAIQFLVNLIQSILTWILVVPRYLAYTTSLFAWLPQPFFAFAAMGLTLSVVLFLLGRGS